MESHTWQSAQRGALCTQISEVIFSVFIIKSSFIGIFPHLSELIAVTSCIITTIYQLIDDAWWEIKEWQNKMCTSENKLFSLRRNINY